MTSEESSCVNTGIQELCLISLLTGHLYGIDRIQGLWVLGFKVSLQGREISIHTVLDEVLMKYICFLFILNKGLL